MFGIQTPIALDPGVGGNCLADTGLQTADIIISTTAAPVSGAIRIGTGSVVSHAALFVGAGMVIEAVEQGVVKRSLQESLAHAALAVAYRVPFMTPAIAAKVVKHADANLGSQYTTRGAILSADPILCRIAGAQPAAFFCSQLVIDAFHKAGVALTTMPAHCVTPQGIAKIAIERLTYVGHLRGNPSWFPILSP
ncbi:hypothetical protein E2493_20165 [Sphingomonas parva]|uniref:Uncharacterized protein n=1 Tax=Sphingomonas parva TaxID=2555898 RepID=A0A4Y8ZNR2_9SPHN|nr:YiiX/YebB-like N1pC/P60 family cysteine hydrolase [Sphingomonas parva]TFI56449.1 hypothetical protein E2493_20165 [Sphingomonas parva]